MWIRELWFEYYGRRWRTLSWLHYVPLYYPHIAINWRTLILSVYTEANSFPLVYFKVFPSLPMSRYEPFVLNRVVLSFLDYRIVLRKQTTFTDCDYLFLLLVIKFSLWIHSHPIYCSTKVYCCRLSLGSTAKSIFYFYHGRNSFIIHFFAGFGSIVAQQLNTFHTFDCIMVSSDNFLITQIDVE